MAQMGRPPAPWVFKLSKLKSDTFKSELVTYAEIAREFRTTTKAVKNFLTKHNADVTHQPNKNGQCLALYKPEKIKKLAQEIVKPFE